MVAPLLILPIFIVPVSSGGFTKDCEWGAEKRRAIHLSGVTIMSARKLAVSLNFEVRCAHFWTSFSSFVAVKRTICGLSNIAKGYVLEG